MRLTKSDFISFLQCPKSFWLLKRHPDDFPHGEFSAFLQKITREGYVVERYVREFFGADADRAVSFQRVFEIEDGLFARADAFEEVHLPVRRCVLAGLWNLACLLHPPCASHAHTIVTKATDSSREAPLPLDCLSQNVAQLEREAKCVRIVGALSKGLQS